MRLIDKPKASEYPAYANMYIKLLPDDGLILQHLEDNLRATKEFMLLIPETKLNYRYMPDKWTIKEILLHISDDERIYAYRALRFARNDQTELPGFEQDNFAKYSGANSRTVADILEEFSTVRQATISLFANLPTDSLMRDGVADGKRATVRALLYHIAGHELHHVNIIKERYLKP
jgi:uncharacterized damage-inducible protein DinB